MAIGRWVAENKSFSALCALASLFGLGWSFYSFYVDRVESNKSTAERKQLLDEFRSLQTNISAVDEINFSVPISERLQNPAFRCAPGHVKQMIRFAVEAEYKALEVKSIADDVQTAASEAAQSAFFDIDGFHIQGPRSLYEFAGKVDDALVRQGFGVQRGHVVERMYVPELPEYERVYCNWVDDYTCDGVTRTSSYKGFLAGRELISPFYDDIRVVVSSVYSGLADNASSPIRSYAHAEITSINKVTAESFDYLSATPLYSRMEYRGGAKLLGNQVVADGHGVIYATVGHYRIEERSEKPVWVRYNKSHEIYAGFSNGEIIGPFFDPVSGNYGEVINEDVRDELNWAIACGDDSRRHF